MTCFEIVPARPRHCGQMARHLRARHLASLTALGVRPHHDLRATFEASAFRRAWLIDGRLAGLGGVIGTLLSPRGFIWLALTDTATRFPVETFREARRQIGVLRETYRDLESVVLAEDAAAKRFAVRLGFTLSPSENPRILVARFAEPEPLKMAA